MRKRQKILISLLIYLLINIVLYFLNPYSSAWHYQDQSPKPMVVVSPDDDSIAVSTIEKTLNEIDLAYNAREPNAWENTQHAAVKLAQWIFLPSTIGLTIKSFFGYMGPANQAQQAFTLSVKQRYNQLVKVGKTKGMQKSGFLFLEEPSLSKKNGDSY